MRCVRSGSLLVLALAFLSACSHDWDQYDPRLGAGASAGTGGAVGGDGGGTTGGTAGGGGTPSGGASGGGGTAGSTGGASGGGGVSGGGGSGNTGGVPSGGGGARGGGGSGNTGGTGGTGGTGSTGGTGGTTGGGGTGGSSPTTATYVANVADCVGLTNPNPDACEAGNVGFFTVDNANDALATTDAGPAPASGGFLRFNLDNAFAGKTITKVDLVVRAGTSSSAISDHSGELWTVSTFTRPDLFTSVPAKIAKVGNDQGTVSSGEIITWTIPNGTISPGSPACFGIFTTSSNGVDYQNLKGSAPPQLIVTYQ